MPEPISLPQTAASDRGGMGPAIADFDGNGLRHFVNQLADGFFLFDRDWKYLVINEAGLAMSGKKEAEMIGKHPSEVFVGLEDSVFAREFARAAAERSPSRFEAFYPPFGLWVKVHAYPVEEGMAVIVRDIGPERTLQKEVEEAERRRVAMIQAIPDRMLWLNNDGIVTEGHEGKSGQFYPPVEELVDRSVLETLPERAAVQMADVLDRLRDVAGEEVFRFSLDHDGAPVVYEARLVSTGAEGVLALIRDITLERRLEQVLLNVAEDERRRIGRDLHDDLGAHLSGVGLMVRRMARQARSGHAVTADDLGEISDYLQEALERIRVLARGLNPIQLHTEGLCGALRTLARDVTRLSGVPVSFRCEMSGYSEWDAFCNLQPDLAENEHLYRIAQEAVQNAVRHSGGTTIDVRLKVLSDSLVLEVQDDGSGKAQVTTDGLGMHLMNYRANLIGGFLRITSTDGDGTIVGCEVQLPEIDKSENEADQ